MPPDPRLCRAVLIGAAAYDHPSWSGRQLPAVRANVTDLAALLRDERCWGLPQEHCVPVIDPVRPEDVIGAIRSAAAAATDTLLVYYAGHGFLARQGATTTLALCTTTTANGEALHAVGYAELAAVVNLSGAARKVVILDCCYAGNALGLMGGHDDLTDIEGVYVLTAVRPYELAVAPIGATHTAFTGELIALLREGVPEAGPELTLDTIHGLLWRRLADRNLPTPSRSDPAGLGRLPLVCNHLPGPSPTDDTLAIDFGTSNTTAVLRLASGAINPLLFDNVATLPSAVNATPDGGLRVGREAVHSSQAAPDSFEANPKRRIDEGTLTLGVHEVPVVDAVAAVLARAAAEGRRLVGAPAGRLVLTHPHTWGARRRSVLEAAALKAGLPRPAFVSEPEAAIAYFLRRTTHPVEAGKLVVLYDFGGGTFDVSTIRRATATGDGWTVVRCNGLDNVGGVNLDEAILGWIEAEVQARDPNAWKRIRSPRTVADRKLRYHLLEDVRYAKERLSQELSVRIPVPVIETDLTLTRSRFEELAHDVVEKTIQLTTSTVAGSNAGPDDIADIILIGGSSQIPLVHRRLQQSTGVKPHPLAQPELVVAEGALYRVLPQPAAPGLAGRLTRELGNPRSVVRGIGWGLAAGLIAGLVLGWTVAPADGYPPLATMAGGIVACAVYGFNVAVATLRRGSESG